MIRTSNSIYSHKKFQIKAKSAEAALQATHQIAASQEATNKELINMAQHILKSHTKKSGEIHFDLVHCEMSSFGLKFKTLFC